MDESKDPGDGKHSVTKFVVLHDFDYIEDPPFELSKEKENLPQKVMFHELKFDVPNKNNDEVTTKTFTCEGDSLKLQ